MPDRVAACCGASVVLGAAHVQTSFDPTLNPGTSLLSESSCCSVPPGTGPGYPGTSPAELF
eukprot:2220338-Rhodomonas_salina.2